MRQKTLYISNYDLDPDLQLTRGDALLQSFQITDLFASSCTSELLSSSSTSITSKSSSTTSSDNSSYHNLYNNDDHKKHSHTLQNLLIQKAKQKVDIKIIDGNQDL